MDKKEILICECHNTEHQLLFLYSEEDGYPMCYLHTHLIKRPIWQRIKYGIKYIFGYQSKFGAFDEFIINPIDSYKLQELLVYLQKNQKINTWDELWAEFVKTKEYNNSYGMNLYSVFFNWLKRNYNVPIER